MSQATSHLTYHSTHTDHGKWLHAPGENFVFAYFSNDMNGIAKVIEWIAFEDALKMSTKIKKAVEETTGQAVPNGLYIGDPKVVIKAMNSIEGMGQQSTGHLHESGKKTAEGITKEFFELVLGGIGGGIGPIMPYLMKSMSEMQVQAKKSASASFGTVIGFISLMPELNAPVTNFVYVYGSAEEKKLLLDVKCNSSAVFPETDSITTDTETQYSYEYDVTAVNFNYVKS